MIANPRSGRPVSGILFAAGLAIGLSACVADGQPGVMSLQAMEAGARPQGPLSASGPAQAQMQAQPRRATYNCGSDGTITVEAMQGAVRLVEAEGSSYDLPASPPSQASRFGEGNVALVVEGGEALWMKAGREPMTCRQ